jgi:hypothetical protein
LPKSLNYFSDSCAALLNQEAQCRDVGDHLGATVGVGFLNLCLNEASVFVELLLVDHGGNSSIAADPSRSHWV